MAAELNSSLLVGFRDLCTRVRGAMPDEAAAMKAEHDAIFKEKIPMIEKIVADLRKKTPAGVGDQYFSEFYSNRIGETHDNQKKVEDICPVGEAGEWWQISGVENSADRPSRVG